MGVTWANVNGSPLGHEQDLNRLSTLMAECLKESPGHERRSAVSVRIPRQDPAGIYSGRLVEAGASVLVIEADDASNTGSASFPGIEAKRITAEDYSQSRPEMRSGQRQGLLRHHARGRISAETAGHPGTSTREVGVTHRLPGVRPFPC